MGYQALTNLKWGSICAGKQASKYTQNHSSQAAQVPPPLFTSFYLQFLLTFLSLSVMCIKAGKSYTFVPCSLRCMEGLLLWRRWASHTNPEVHKRSSFSPPFSILCSVSMLE